MSMMVYSFVQEEKSYLYLEAKRDYVLVVGVFSVHEGGYLYERH